jgi:CheY-like chemotaxis protein
MSKKVIFIVDDTDEIRCSLYYALAGDYDIMTMDSADKMMKSLHQVVPDLILLDYYMPGLTFHETMNRLKAYPGYANIPVIVISGSCYPELIDEIYSMGAVDFHAKPIDDADILVGKIIKALGTV